MENASGTVDNAAGVSSDKLADAGAPPAKRVKFADEVDADAAPQLPETAEDSPPSHALGDAGFQLVCRLCNSPFRDPTSLLCGHNFCLNCLEEHFHECHDRGRTLSCPDPLCPHKCKFADGRLKPNATLALLLDSRAPPEEANQDAKDYREMREAYSMFAVDTTDVIALQRRINWLRTRLALMKRRVGFCAGMRRVELPKDKADALVVAEKAYALFAAYINVIAGRYFRIGRPGGIAHRLYDVFMMDIPWQDVDANSDRMQKLREIPLRGLAAENSLLILTTAPCHLARAIEYMGSMGFEYRTVLVELQYADGSTVQRQPKPYSRHENVYFIIGTMGVVPFLTEANFKGKIMIVRHKKLAIYPSIFWTELHKLLNYANKYKYRLKLFNSERIVGWENWAGDLPAEAVPPAPPHAENEIDNKD